MKAVKAFLAVCIALFAAVQAAFSAKAEFSDNISLCFSYFFGENRDFIGSLEYGKADWAAYCYLRLYGGEGAEKYAKSAENYVKTKAEKGGFVPPTDYQKAALCIAAAGGNPEQAATLGVYQCEGLDKQGFNAYIWGLIAANVTQITPPENAVNTPETLAEHIISKQHEDGSFSLFGESGDVDITAAAVYALSGCDFPQALEAAKQGADWLCGLSEFSSMGVENCESTAQAAIAFYSLGMTEQAENAVSLLEKFKADGGYSHIEGGEKNAIATSQALQAFAAAELHGKGERLFGEITHKAPEKEQPEKIVTAEEHIIDVPAEKITGVHIKAIISAVFGILAVLCGIFAVFRKKRLFFAAAVLGLCCGGVWLLEIRTPQEYYSQKNTGEMTVTLSVDCSTVLENSEKIDISVNPPEVIPQDGIVIKTRTVKLPAGSDAFDALIAAAREQRVAVDYSGGIYGVYIKGIGQIYEFGFGELSGWLFKVNGEFPDRSAGEITLKDGDFVEFVYTCDLGGDVGNKYSPE